MARPHHRKTLSPKDAFFKAAQSRNARDAMHALNRGFDVHAKLGLHKRTALHIACRYGLADATRKIVSCGAHTGLKDAAGRTPMDLAAIYGHSECAALLLQAGARSHSATGLAIQHGHFALAEMIKDWTRNPIAAQHGFRRTQLPRLGAWPGPEKL